jgi:hypothetical protein
MSFRGARRNSKGYRAAGSARVGDQARAGMDAGKRWDVSALGASNRTMPRLGPVLLAIAVVALLTVGLHMLFQ